MREEEDLYRPAVEAAQSSQIEIGTVGWNDRDEWYDKGSVDNDGHTLVFVTLFRGSDHTTRPERGVANGMQIICHIADMIHRIPPKGAKCWVAIPHGMEETPGAGVIMATSSPSPNRLEEDRAVYDMGDVHLIFKAKSVSLQSYANEFISVGEPRSGGTSGLTFQASDGTGGVIQTGVVGWFVASGGDAKTLFQMKTDGIDCCVKGGGMWKLDGDFYTLGTSATLAVGAVYLGKTPAAATPVVLMVAGVPTPSASVFGSLT